MRRATNNEKVEGRLFSHDLVIKTVQNQSSANYGKEFITGNINIAVDEEGLNVIPVHYTYVVETTANGGKNSTYSHLKRIIEGGKTWTTDGKDEALKVKADTALAVNDFYNQNDELISSKVNEGGFVTIVNELGVEGERNTFTVDMVITGVTRVEANPERNIEKDYVTVKGAIFNFRNDLMPVEFSVRNEAGMSHFESLGVTGADPIYTKVWGKIECRTVTNTVTEESAFGEPQVRTYERKSKDWTITGMAKVPHDLGDENVLTKEELTKASQDREIMLAEVKKRSDEYRANRGAAQATPVATTTSAPAPAAATPAGNFNF